MPSGLASSHLQEDLREKGEELHGWIRASAKHSTAEVWILKALFQSSEANNKDYTKTYGWRLAQIKHLEAGKQYEAWTSWSFWWSSFCNLRTFKKEAHQ